MKTYLVTGGAGFIGSNFILYLFEKYGEQVKVINLDKLTYAGNLENLRSVEELDNYTFVKGDICDRQVVDGLFQKYDIDYVVNFAAESHVDRSITNPEVFVYTNVLGTQTLLHAAKEHWWENRQFKVGKKYLQVSTDEVYGSLGEEGYFTEETPLNPHSPYSASKAGADLLVQAFFDTYSLPICITRCSNNYGPFQFPEKLIPLMIHNCLNAKPLPVYGDGQNVRDWLYVRDHCAAIDLVLQGGKMGEVYNIGGNNEKKNTDIIKTIIQTVRSAVPEGFVGKDLISEDLIKFVTDRQGHDRRYAIDAGKIKAELGWTPEVFFEQGIAETVHWYLANREWLRRVTSGDYQRYYEKMYGDL